jgi:hypothetical protein
MALTIDAERSPRLIFVDSATNEVTIQGLVDELRDWEDDPGLGMVYPRIISAAGKEPLGGGVEVGITATLQNARLAFSPDPTTTSGGTATSASSTGQTLVDTAATFQTDGVTVGANVTNATTGAFGTVLSIDSETQLTLRTLNGGTRQDFQAGDSYFVHNVVQKSVSGGNLVAVDANGAEIDSIYPTAYTQVVRTSSSSATLLNQFALEHGSFDGAVWVKPSSPYSGTSFPVGTLLQPVNNMADALTIAINEGFSVFNLLEAVTIPATGDFSNKAFRGPVSATPVTIAAGAQVDNCDYEVLQLSGQLSGSSLLRDCLIVNVTDFNGIMENCVIAGSVACTGSADTLFVNCYSSVDVVTVPTVSLGGASGPDVVFRGYVGDIRLTDLSRAAAKVSLDFVSGDLILDPTVANGTIVARGIGTVADNSTAPAVVQSKILNADNVNNSLFDGEITIDAASGEAGTEFPLGTRSFPVSNLADAKTIAANESINKFRFIGNFTFGATDVIDNYVLCGSGQEATTLTLTAGVSTDNSLFIDASIQGTCGGYTRVRDCELTTSVSNMEGLFENCIFRVGTYTLAGDNTKLFVANNCKSGVVTGQPQPIFDCNGDGASFITRAWSGPYKVTNKTNNVSGICFDFISGKLVLDSTITAGHFPVRGTVYVLNNMTGTATAELEGVGSAYQNADFVWDEVVSKNAHNGAQSAGRQLRQAGTLIAADGQVDDLAATATSFVTTLTSTTDDFYNDQTIVFTGGALEGQSRIITGYDGTTKRITVEEAFSFAPSDTDDFDITAQHVHPVSQIAAAVGGRTVESTYTADEVIKIMASALAGKVSGAGSGVETFKGLDGTTDRIVSTVDSSGNRTSVVVDGS